MNEKANIPVAVRFNQEFFASETFGNEVIVLHTIDGTYYAFGGSTPYFWEDLISGRSIDRIVAALERGALTAGSEVRGSIASFVAALMDEQILLPRETDTEGQMFSDQNASAALFVAPTIEKHVDMQDLLTLDPIHDVEPDKGWPYT